MASPAVNELKTVEKQQDNYKFTKDFGAQKRTRTSTSIRTLAPEAISIFIFYRIYSIY